MAKCLQIHPSSIIEGNVIFEGSVKVGPFCVISGNVRIGDGCILHSHVVIRGVVEVGLKNEFWPFSCIGGEPQHLTASGKGGIKIGDNNVFREGVTVHCSTTERPTTIGNNNYFMVGSHVAHDCHVGSFNVLANHVDIAGHVEIGDRIFFGGLSGVHQHARVGSYSMIAAGSMVSKDVAPFTLVCGDRARTVGINTEGLRRAGFTKDQINLVKEIFRIFFIEEKVISEAIRKIEEKFMNNEIGKIFLDFIKNSKRGITK